MTESGTCPYCGGFNKLKRGKAHIACEICGARLAVKTDGTLVPDDDSATPLASLDDNATQFTDDALFDDLTALSYGNQTQEKLKRSSDGTFSHSPELAKRFFIFDRSHKHFVTTGKQRGGGLFAGASTGCTTLFMIPFVLAGIFVFGWFIKETIDWNRLKTEGQIIRGRMLSSWTDTDDDGTSYYVQYDYTVGDNTYLDRISSRKAYNDFEIGALIDVRYWPDNPNLSELPAYGGLNPALFLGFFTLVWNLFVWAMVIGTWRAYIKKRQLFNRAKGQLIPGEIVKTKGYKDSDNDFKLKVTYAFTSPESGQRIEKKQSTTRNDLRKKGAPPKGIPVLILYVNDDLHCVM